MATDDHQPRDLTYEVIQAQGVSDQHLNLDDLRAMPLAVSMELGSTVMRVRDVLELKPGAVVPLNKLAGEMTDILVNDVPLARGEVMVIGDELHVRVGEVLNTPEDMG